MRNRAGLRKDIVLLIAVDHRTGFRSPHTGLVLGVEAGKLARIIHGFWKIV